MANFLTEGTKISCSHEGTITFSPNPGIKLTVSKKRVIVADDVQTVTGCTNSSPKPCMKVTIVPNPSPKLTVSGKAVLTTGLSAATDGAPPTLTVSEQQSKLTTKT